MESNADSELLTLWHLQAKEEPHLPLDGIRVKAQHLDARTRRWRTVTVALFVVLIAWEAWQVWTQDALLERAGDLLTIAALVYVAHRFRQYRLAPAPVVLGRMNCVEFYRAELVRQRDLAKDSWGFLLPFVPGVALALFGGGFQDRPIGHLLALAAAGVALFAGVAWWNARSARKLQEEINAAEELF